MTEEEQKHAGSELYDENFYKSIKEASKISAQSLLPEILKFMRPKTVIDIGCGAGSWLAVWQELGAEVVGVDGDYVDREQLMIDEKFFRPMNLEERINIDERFDLAMTMEVAEHLSPKRADSFVEDLTKLSDVILFSAAIPGQGGTNHVNEQWQSYWQAKFLNCGYVGVDYLRSKTWYNAGIGSIYLSNTLIYVKRSELYRYPELEKYYLEHRDSMVVDVVHPLTWINCMSNLINTQNQLIAKINELTNSAEKSE